MSPPAPKVRALLVEPDAELAATLTERLAAGLGADVHLAGTRADAEQLLAAGTYHLLVLADRLPDGEGVDLVAAARKRAPDLAVLFLAPLGREGAALRALQHGAAAHVPLEGDVGAETLFAARSALARRRLVPSGAPSDVPSAAPSAMPFAAPVPGHPEPLVAPASTEAGGRAARAVEHALRTRGVQGAAVFAADGSPLDARLGATVGALECGALAVRTQASSGALARLSALEPRGSMCLLDLGDVRLALGRLDEAHLGAVLMPAAAGPGAAADALGELAAGFHQ